MECTITYMNNTYLVLKPRPQLLEQDDHSLQEEPREKKVVSFVQEFNPLFG